MLITSAFMHVYACCTCAWTYMYYVIACSLIIIMIMHSCGSTKCLVLVQRLHNTRTLLYRLVQDSLQECWEFYTIALLILLGDRFLWKYIQSIHFHYRLISEIFLSKYKNDDYRQFLHGANYHIFCMHHSACKKRNTIFEQLKSYAWTSASWHTLYCE